MSFCKGPSSSAIHIFDPSQKPSARSTSNLVGMCLRWVSTKFVQMVTVQWFLDLLWIFSFIFGIHSYCLLCKSMGIAILIDILDSISKTVSQIHFKCGGDLPWIDAYCVYSYGHASIIFLFDMNFYIHFWHPFILITMQVNGACKVNRNCNAN